MTLEALLERMKQDDMNERRYLLMRLAQIEERWGLPRTVQVAEKRRVELRHPNETNRIPSPG